MGAWFDEYHSAYAREVGRLVAGQTFQIGDNESGIREREFTVTGIKNVVVGIDSTGIFAAINVYDEDGFAWSLYSDGTICEYETDHEVGRHNLKTRPLVEPATQQSLADRARETAEMMHRAEFGRVA